MTSEDGRAVLDHDLQEVAAQVVRMLSLVRESVGHAGRALIHADPDGAERAVTVDREIDDLQEVLERRILLIIARRRPASEDLRFLGAMHRALADVERAGDYAVHVARAGAALADRPPLKRYLDMQRMLEVADAMIEATIAALVEADADAARSAFRMDEEIDDLYEQVQRELLTYMMADPATIPVATRLLSVGRYLERLGDHLENVCEHIVFWRSGERI
ncbi:MAG: phosphate signaling complex protein PhoU [Trueperaceae bacterium]